MLVLTVGHQLPSKLNLRAKPTQVGLSKCKSRRRSNQMWRLRRHVVGDMILTSPRPVLLAGKDATLTSRLLAAEIAERNLHHLVVGATIPIHLHREAGGGLILTRLHRGVGRKKLLHLDADNVTILTPPHLVVAIEIRRHQGAVNVTILMHLRQERKKKTLHHPADANITILTHLLRGRKIKMLRLLGALDSDMILMLLHHAEAERMPLHHVVDNATILMLHHLVGVSRPNLMPRRQGDVMMAGKTLEGKKSGLQSAKDMKEEAVRLREREKKRFAEMDEEQSGRNAEAVTRTKTYGKREKPEDKEKKQREAAKQAELQEKYQMWNKGVKQLADREAKLQEAARVAVEPLTRTKDDEAMNDHLKEVLYEDDPMAAFITKKRQKDDIAAGRTVYPQYQGNFPPNRYGIRPGYRWDGVDRGNGFEGKIALESNRRRANEGEYYQNIQTYE
ncbi:unnamed protein product, partial [Mesorhabditis spiculigera]